MLFALYIVDIGADLVSSQDGFLVGVSVSLASCLLMILFWYLVLLRGLIGVVKHRCDELLLEVNTGEGKTELVSPSDDLWDILEVDGNVELSLRHIVEFTYLGLETSSSILQSTLAKQSKCFNIARKYKFVCLHVSRSGLML
jgi:hypothetical protein